MVDRLGELLVREKLITADQLKKAIDEQRSSGGRLGYNLAKLGYVNEKDLTTFLSKQYGIPAVDLAATEIDPEIIKQIPQDVANKYQVIPISRTGSTLVIAMADPSNIFAIDDLKFLTGYNIDSVVASEAAIKDAIEKHYASHEEEMLLGDVLTEFDESEMQIVHDEEQVDVNDLKKAVEDAPVVKLVNLILTDAIKRGASDIHVEPYEKSFRVRYRVDGILSEFMKPPLKLKNAIVSRIKIMSSLDIAERRLPQDGRIKLKMGKDKEMDYRVSVLPTLFGEKVVMRLLDKSNLQLDMTKLGFEEKALKDFKDAIEKPWGMVLVTGPTGSGKTTTLYSALSELNKITDNISTAEDPVEFNLAGINQVQMHEAIGLNFASALRSFLRQDPDIIMVGEIRDFETAEIAVKAALTGHLVLSTLHTNDAPSTVNRLLNMGVEPFLIASAANLILAQRLARKICKDCKQEIHVPPQALIDIGITPEEAKSFKCFHGKGCATCGGTGYKGRIALYEVMPLTDNLKELVLNGASSAELKRGAIKEGMKTLRMSGITKLKEDVTTIEEVVRATMAD
jgi:type IV pilus assembly protein PilB